MSVTSQPEEHHKMILRVHVTSGRVNEHVYDLLPNLQDAQKEVKSWIGIITDAFKGKIDYLPLLNPVIAYNIPHIVFVELDFKGPTEWQEVIRKSVKEPIGYKFPGKVAEET